VFFVFGRATRARLIESDSGSFAISKGDLTMGVIPFAHRDEFTFPRPEDFNPHRFDDPAASAHLIWPRGRHDDTVLPDDRTCPGKDAAILIAKLFAVSLLRDFDWRLSTRKQRWDQRFFGLNVAAPVGPLEVETFHRR
jgi:cytochrome P450